MSPAVSFGAIYIPNFILQAIGRSEPELRAQPLAIIDGPPPTYQVVALNRLAEILGVTLGMTKAAVSQFAQVTIRPRYKVKEEAAHAALLDVAWSVTPRVEDAAPDTLLVDISGLGSLFGEEINIAGTTLAGMVRAGIAADLRKIPDTDGAAPRAGRLQYADRIGAAALGLSGHHRHLPWVLRVSQVSAMWSR